MVDLTSHLNQLNLKLQGRGNTAFILLEEILCFEKKLNFFMTDLRNGELLHFAFLQKYQQESSNIIDINFFANTIIKLKEAFADRFEDFRKLKTILSFLTKPLDVEVNELLFSQFPLVDRAQFQRQLLDLKSKELWLNNFSKLSLALESFEKRKCLVSSEHKWSALSSLEKYDKIIYDTWNCLPICYNHIKSYAFGLLTIFGSTYYCEQLFSNMNLLKGKLRSSLDDVSLESCLKLKVTEYSPNISNLVQDMQGQASH